MQRIDIDERIRAYGSQALSTEVRTRLGAMVSADRGRWGRDRWKGAHRAADRTAEQVAGVLAHQAALCHNGRRQFEFQAGTPAELTARMESLDFTLVEPDIMKTMSVRVVGARYTTLDGVLAAQIACWREKGLLLILARHLVTERGCGAGRSCSPRWLSKGAVR